MDLKFRALCADEIDCRVAMIKKDGSGLSLLLYKDARVDQNILDETVGPMNWQRRHTRENANCIVSVWDPEKAQWIEKEDTGTESNTEAEKGLASDSFKRACFNWGIGRELYTAPFIWISGEKCKIGFRKNNKGEEIPYCNDKFSVVKMTVTAGKITYLAIANSSRGNEIVYTYGGLAPEKAVNEEPKREVKREEPRSAADRTVDPDMVKAIVILAEKTDTDMQMILQQAGVKTLTELSQKAGEQLLKALQRKAVRLNREAGNEAQRQTA